MTSLFAYDSKYVVFTYIPFFHKGWGRYESSFTFVYQQTLLHCDYYTKSSMTSSQWAKGVRDHLLI